jgi:hypothetical protein
MRHWLKQNQEVLYSSGTAVFVFLIYWLTLAPDLTWQANSGDGGELITAAVTLGIPHPPGYPTYILLGKLVSFLPFEPIAYRFHIFSAICTATAAGVVTATAHLLITKADTAIPVQIAFVPGLIFAFSPLVWDQAIVAEVYSLNLLMVAVFVWTLLGKRPPFVIGLFFGLSLTTHLTSLFLLPMALLLTTPKTWGSLTVGTLGGASPYLILPLLARQGSPVMWGDPTTVTGWWWLVSAQIYQANQFALPLSNLLPRFTIWAAIFAKQMAILAWPLLFLAAWTPKNGRLALKKVWGGLGGTAVFYLLYALFYNTQDAIVLTLPAWLLLSLCLIPGFKSLGKWGFFLPGMALLLHLLSYNGANIHNIRQQAEQILGSAPSGAILITSGDPDIFALWYFHHVEGQRPDIVLVDKELFAFDWYRHNLEQHHSTLRALEEDNLALFEATNKSHRDICWVYFSPEPNGDGAIDCLQDNNE